MNFNSRKSPYFAENVQINFGTSRNTFVGNRCKVYCSAYSEEHGMNAALIFSVVFAGALQNSSAPSLE